MNPDIRQSKKADDYLRQLGAALKAMPADAVTEIVAELRSHLIDTACDEGRWDAERLDAAISRLGDPADLASEYLMENLALRATASRSPILLIRLAASWAMRTFEGARVLLAAIIGYGFAAVSLACAVTKPFLPSRVGLWLLENPDGVASFQLGRVLTPPAGGREILGWYIIPLGLALGAVAFAATTRYLLGKARKLRTRRASLTEL